MWLRPPISSSPLARAYASERCRLLDLRLARSSLLILSLFLLCLSCSLGATRAHAQGFALNLLTPSDGECVSSEYTEQSPFTGGFINGNAQPISNTLVRFSLSSPPADPLSIALRVGTVTPAFEQPDPATCPSWTFGQDPVAACGGQGYCIFTKRCICLTNNDCNGGAGVCRPDQTCGCANNAQCGAGQVCTPQGECECGDNSACGAGQTCRPDGVCTCATSDDCGAGLVCSGGVCGVPSASDVTYIDVIEPSDGLIVEAPLPPGTLDSNALSLELTASSQLTGQPLASSSVGFSLDREFPLIRHTNFCVDNTNCAGGQVCDDARKRCVTPAEAALGPCRPEDDLSGALPANYELSDNLDAAPQVLHLPAEEQGCLSTQRLMLKDSCGNAQVVAITSQRAPLPGEVQAALEGFRCFGEPCDTGATGTQIASGDSAARALVRSEVTAPEGCYEYVTSTISDLVDGAPANTRLHFDDETLQATPAQVMSTRALTAANGALNIVHGGPFNLTDGSTLEVTTSGVTEVVTFRAADFYNISEALNIDVLRVINEQITGAFSYLDGTALMLRSRRIGAGVSLEVGGSAAASLGFTPEFESDAAVGEGDGARRVSMSLYACGSPTPLITDSFDVTIIATQEVSIGGPFSVLEGAPLTVSTQSVFVPAEYGGVARVEWDIDGDGVFEPALTRDFDPAVETLDGTLAQGSAVELDTTENGAFVVTLRLTTGLGEQLQARAGVEVLDATPLCVLPQALYTIPEGVLLTLNAPASVAGSDADPVSAYRWDFGDGATASTPEPSTSHSYGAQGEYTLTLSVEDEDSSCSPAATAIVRVTGVVPIVEGVGLADPDAAPVEGAPVRFTAGDTRAGAASDPITLYRWDLGYSVNGARVIMEGPQLDALEHTFLDDGDYAVCLTVSDTDDTAAPVCFNVTVADLAPTAIWDGPTQGLEGEELTFDATGTVAGGATDALRSLRWSFGDGSAPVTTPPTQLTVTHTFTRDSGATTFSVTVAAIDEDGEVTFSRPVQVLDVSPRAGFTIIFPDPSFEAAYEGEEVTLNAGASAAGALSDPIARYRWDFGDGSAERVTTSPVTAYRWPDGPRDHTVRLTVEDSDGSIAVATQGLSVVNVDPVVSIRPNQERVEAGSPASFTLEVQDVLGDRPGTSDNPLIIEWDVGDGLTAGGATFTHTFASEGRLTLRARFVDGDGGEAEAELPVVVEAPPPTLLGAVVTVHTELGAAVADPTLPIGEFVGSVVDASTFYLREGEALSMSVPVRSASLASGIADDATAVWVVAPSGADLSYADEQGGVRATLEWAPSFFQAGQYIIRLTAEGARTGSAVTREWRVRVAEAGTPMLAATTGSQRRGRVLLYTYSKENNRVSFTPTREVEVGMGAYDVESDPATGRLFVSAPVSGHVAVIGGDPLRLLRRIPTGAGAYDMAMGGGYLWVVNAEASTVTAVDLARLKAQRTLPLARGARPLSVLYVGEEYGLATGRVLVGDAHGALHVINADRMIAGDGGAAVEGTAQLGGALTHLVASLPVAPAAGMPGRPAALYAADLKSRAVWTAALNTVVVSPDRATFSRVEGLHFAAQDLALTPDGLWAATGDDLWFSSLDAPSFAPLGLPTSRLAPLSGDYIESEGVVISDGARLDNYTLDAEGALTPLVGVNGARVQRLTPFLLRARP